MVLKQSSLLNRNDFLINCPTCGRMCRVTPDDLGESARIVKIYGMDGLYIYQCHCGSRFNLRLDFRRKPRHQCDISSFYTTLTRTSYGKKPETAGQGQYQRRINSVIKNISVDGIGLMIMGRHDIQPEDELLVTFTIKQGVKEKILERRIVVRSVRQNFIGGEFFPADKKRPEIGFFLMQD